MVARGASAGQIVISPRLVCAFGPPPKDDFRPSDVPVPCTRSPGGVPADVTRRRIRYRYGGAVAQVSPSWHIRTVPAGNTTSRSPARNASSAAR